MAKTKFETITLETMAESEANFRELHPMLYHMANPEGDDAVTSLYENMEYNQSAARGLIRGASNIGHFLYGVGQFFYDIGNSTAYHTEKLSLEAKEKFCVGFVSLFSKDSAEKLENDYRKRLVDMQVKYKTSNSGTRNQETLDSVTKAINSCQNFGKDYMIIGRAIDQATLYPANREKYFNSPEYKKALTNMHQRHHYIRQAAKTVKADFDRDPVEFVYALGTECVLSVGLGKATKIAGGILKPSPKLTPQLRQIKHAITRDFNATKLAGRTIYHGTVEGHVKSILNGPKNVGRGFGGPGLYATLDNEFHIAHESANIALRNAAKGERSVVMTGKINPNRNYDVARIKLANRYQTPNIEQGLFPADWEKIDELKDFITKNYDILEVTGAKSAGYAIDTDKFIVFNERAGKEAIKWLEHKIIDQPKPGLNTTGAEFLSVKYPDQAEKFTLVHSKAVVKSATEAGCIYHHGLNLFPEQKKQVTSKSADAQRTAGTPIGKDSSQKSILIPNQSDSQPVTQADNKHDMLENNLPTAQESKEPDKEESKNVALQSVSNDGQHEESNSGEDNVFDLGDAVNVLQTVDCVLGIFTKIKGEKKEIEQKARTVAKQGNALISQHEKRLRYDIPVFNGFFGVNQLQGLTIDDMKQYAEDLCKACDVLFSEYSAREDIDNQIKPTILDSLFEMKKVVQSLNKTKFTDIEGYCEATVIMAATALGGGLGAQLATLGISIGEQLGILGSHKRHAKRRLKRRQERLQAFDNNASHAFDIKSHNQSAMYSRLSQGQYLLDTIDKNPLIQVREKQEAFSKYKAIYEKQYQRVVESQKQNYKLLATIQEQKEAFIKQNLNENKLQFELDNNGKVVIKDGVPVLSYDELGNPVLREEYREKLQAEYDALKLQEIECKEMEIHFNAQSKTVKDEIAALDKKLAVYDFKANEKLLERHRKWMMGGVDDDKKDGNQVLPDVGNPPSEKIDIAIKSQEKIEEKSSQQEKGKEEKPAADTNLPAEKIISTGNEKLTKEEKKEKKKVEKAIKSQEKAEEKKRKKEKSKEEKSGEAKDEKNLIENGAEKKKSPEDIKKEEDEIIRHFQRNLDVAIADRDAKIQRDNYQYDLMLHACGNTISGVARIYYALANRKDISDELRKELLERLRVVERVQAGFSLLNQLFELKKSGEKLGFSLFINEIKQELGLLSLLPSLEYLSKPKEMLIGALSAIKEIPGKFNNVTFEQLLKLYILPASGMLTAGLMALSFGIEAFSDKIPSQELHAIEQLHKLVESNFNRVFAQLRNHSDSIHDKVDLLYGELKTHLERNELQQSQILIHTSKAQADHAQIFNLEQLKQLNAIKDKLTQFKVQPLINTLITFASLAASHELNESNLEIKRAQLFEMLSLIQTLLKASSAKDDNFLLVTNHTQRMSVSPIDYLKPFVQQLRAGYGLFVALENEMDDMPGLRTMIESTALLHSLIETLRNTQKDSEYEGFLNSTVLRELINTIHDTSKSYIAILSGINAQITTHDPSKSLLTRLLVDYGRAEMQFYGFVDNLKNNRALDCQEKRRTEELTRQKKSHVETLNQIDIFFKQYKPTPTDKFALSKIVHHSPVDTASLSRTYNVVSGLGLGGFGGFFGSAVVVNVANVASAMVAGPLGPVATSTLAYGTMGAVTAGSLVFAGWFGSDYDKLHSITLAEDAKEGLRYLNSLYSDRHSKFYLEPNYPLVEFSTFEGTKIPPLTLISWEKPTNIQLFNKPIDCKELAKIPNRFGNGSYKKTLEREQQYNQTFLKRIDDYLEAIRLALNQRLPKNVYPAVKIGETVLTDAKLVQSHSRNHPPLFFPRIYIENLVKHNPEIFTLFEEDELVIRYVFGFNEEGNNHQLNLILMNARESIVYLYPIATFNQETLNAYRVIKENKEENKFEFHRHDYNFEFLLIAMYGTPEESLIGLPNNLSHVFKAFPDYTFADESSFPGLYKLFESMAILRLTVCDSEPKHSVQQHLNSLYVYQQGDDLVLQREAIKTKLPGSFTNYITKQCAKDNQSPIDYMRLNKQLVLDKLTNVLSLYAFITRFNFNHAHHSANSFKKMKEFISSGDYQQLKQFLTAKDGRYDYVMLSESADLGLLNLLITAHKQKRQDALLSFYERAFMHDSFTSMCKIYDLICSSLMLALGEDKTKAIIARLGLIDPIALQKQLRNDPTLSVEDALEHLKKINTVTSSQGLQELFEKTAMDAGTKNENFEKNPQLAISDLKKLGLFTNNEFKKAANPSRLASANQSSFFQTKRYQIPGLKFEAVPRDGHCFYYAVGLYLGKHQAEARDYIATEFEHYFDELKDYIDLNGKTKEQYIEDIRSTKKWAGHVEITALMMATKRPVISILQDGKISNRDNLEELLNKYPGEPIFVAYNGKNHYDALVLSQPERMSAGEVLNKLLSLEVNIERRQESDESETKPASAMAQ